MGKVFTPQEIRSGHVPSVADFDRLAAQYREWLPSEPWFAGGILAGSVLQGKHNVRSDIDLFVAFLGREADATGALHRFRHLAQGNPYVPVNINLWNVHELERSNHTVGFGFRSHLEWAAAHGGLIGKNPLVHLRLANRHNAREDLASYLAKKIKRLREFSCENDRWTEARCKTLENVAAASLHATRRWLAFRGHSDDDFRNKEDVIARLQEHRADLGNELRTLVDADVTYGKALEKALTQNQNDRKAYTHALEKLSTHTGGASVFLGKLYS